MAESGGDWAEEGREGERAVAAKGPCLAADGDQDRETHEELDDEQERHEAQRARFTHRVVVDLVIESALT